MRRRRRRRANAEALGAKTASDVAKKSPAALVAALGLAPAVAERAVLAARGVCDAPVVSAAPPTERWACTRRSPRRRDECRTRPGFEPVTSASGGRAGTFEPVRVWERDRVDGLVDAMARDLAGRVCDDAAAEKRWPRTLTASVATKIAPDAATTTKSKSRAFPAKTPNARGWSELDVANACAEACRALVRATIVGVDAETLVTKVSLTATGFKPERSGDDTLKSAFRRMGGDADGETGGERGGERGGEKGGDVDAVRRGRVDDEGFFPPFRVDPSAERMRRRRSGEAPARRRGERSERADAEIAASAADGSRPLPVASMWRLLGARKITAEEVRDARCGRRLEEVGKMRIGNT